MFYHDYLLFLDVRILGTVLQDVCDATERSINVIFKVHRTRSAHQIYPPDFLAL